MTRSDELVPLFISMLLVAGFVMPALADELQEDIDYLMNVDDFNNEEILDKWKRVVSQGERLYPIVIRKLAASSDPIAVSRLLSIVVESEGDKSTVMPAIRTLARSKAAQESPGTLFHVARSLGEIGGRDDVPVLLELFQHDEERVRINAARALGKIAGPEAIERIREIIEERATNLTREDVRRDYSLLEGYLAIAHLEHRALIQSRARRRGP